MTLGTNLLIQCSDSNKYSSIPLNKFGLYKELLFNCNNLNSTYYKKINLFLDSATLISIDSIGIVTVKEIGTLKLDSKFDKYRINVFKVKYLTSLRDTIELLIFSGFSKNRFYRNSYKIEIFKGKNNDINFYLFSFVYDALKPNSVDECITIKTTQYTFK